MAKMIDVDTLWKCETCFHHKNDGCSPEIWCENGEGYRPDYNKLVIIEAEPVKYGKWSKPMEGKERAFQCNLCGGIAYTHGLATVCSYKNCPHCNARMDGE